MIVELILKGLIGIGKLLMNLLPKFELALPAGLLGTITSIFQGLGYFLPMGTITSILALQLGFYTFKFVYNMITEMKEWTPGI